MTSYQLNYLGFATVDKRLSNPMLPWVIAQIKRAGTSHEVTGRLSKCCLELTGPGVRLSHQLNQVARLGVYPGEGDAGYLVYALRDRDQPLLYCHLLYSNDIHDVLELLSSMKEQQSRAKTPTSLCPDISPSSSHFFEVLYIGRIKVSHKKVPETFIDEALERFKIFERQRKERGNSTIHEEVRLVNGINSKASITYSSSETLKEENSSALGKTDEGFISRRRSGSVGTVLSPERKNDQRESLTTQDHNRTMVFHVGRTDLRLISPDRKQVLLHKYLRDITSSLQGHKETSHFAFVAKESSVDANSNYVGYVFKCESPSVAEDIVAAINQASICEKKSSVVSCEGCPMVWYHRLCTELETAGGGGGTGAWEIVRRRLESLPSEEAAVVRTKLEGGGASGSADSIEVTMMLLRAHCEASQARHVHDTIETRHEFLSHYLGGGNAIFLKAKRSLTSSFDQLLKRRGSRDDLHHSVSLPHNATLGKELSIDTPTKSISETDAPEEPGTPGSMKNIFMKLGKSTPRTPDELRPRSWRQAIFNNVVTPNKVLQKDAENKVKRDRSYYRDLWKKAINQQVLLIRMEKENARLTARQEEANVKRIKLEYEELGSEVSADVWEHLISQSNGMSAKLLSNTLRHGIPKGRRGELWMQIAEKYDDEHPCHSKVDLNEFPNYHSAYEDLLKQLTSHQHAILIDLGRTFPNHPYYSSPLGPGQLSLFNILKAYSLLDPGVGYCQGLSFTAGLLLLHVSEAEAFTLLKHLMFSRGLRERYLPDMSALQVCLYQLSRLLHDLHPDLYSHFDQLDIAPSLYAAPWLLTIFSSQFTLGFVARIFDLIFGDSPLTLFKVAIALLGQHKEELLACESFEEVMNYLKTKLPKVSNATMDSIINEVVSTDVTRELIDYGVEYHVLEEQMSSPRPEVKRIKELETANQALTEQIFSLQRLLQMAKCDIKRLESMRDSHVAELRKADGDVEEARVQSRSHREDITTLASFLAELLEADPAITVPTNVHRILRQHGVNLLPKTKGELRSQTSCPELKSPPAAEPSTARPEKTTSGGRILTDAEKAALVQSRQAAIERVKKPALSALELQRPHPLDCDEVKTCFEGTVKLQSIPPLRRAETIFNHKNAEPARPMLRRAETVMTTDKTTAPLRIVEPTDLVSAKIRSTKDRVSRLFEFDKPFSKQTQILIKSQAPQKANSLLT